MSSMTFLINDSATSGGTNPVLQVTITENPDGTVTFSIIQLDTAGSYLGDLRGLFFDLADESLIGSLTTAPTANLTELQQGNDTVTNLGDGANMSGLLGGDSGYDVGVEIGTSGIGSNDIRSFTFTLDSSLRNLTLADFSNVSFGARVTSVGMDINGDGTIDTARTGSSKTGEVTFKTITPANDSKALLEDAVATGNVLSNDGAGVGDTLSVTGWTGGALGTAVTPAGLFGATVTLNANGTYTIDASAADALAAGQVVTKTFTYTVLQTNVDGTSLQTATLTVTITGTNDAPVAVADSNGADAVVESGVNPGNTPNAGDASATGNVLANDTDVDTGASKTVTTTGVLAGTYGSLSLAANGSWTYTLDNTDTDTNALAQGALASEVFNYTMSDEFGATSSSTLTINLTGTNDAPDIQVVTTDSAAKTLTETNAGLVTSGTLTATDADTTNTVATSITGVVATGTIAGLGLTNTQLLSMFSVSPATGLAADTGTQHNLNWSFNSGTQAFDYLAAGQSLVLTYTLQASDGQGGSDTQQVTVTVNGTADGMTDIVLTAIASGVGTTNVPSGILGQLSATGSTGTVSFAASLVEKNLAGVVQADVDGTLDINVTSTGSVDAAGGSNGFQDQRIYELNVTATDSVGSLAELMRIVTGSTGDESINLAGSVDDLFFLAAGTDTVFAGAGNDTVFGQSGADLIHGGDGNDILYGNAGADTFYFDTALNATTNVDTITDFNSGADKINLENTGAGLFNALLSTGVLSAGALDIVGIGAAADGNTRIIYDPVSGALYYDADGTGVAGSVQFATLGTTIHPGTVVNTDFVVS